MKKNVFVSGCFDPLHSGHIEFFKRAAKYGYLHVGIGSDESIENHKHHKPFSPEQERLFMVESIKYVKSAWILSGVGVMDFIEDLSRECKVYMFDIMIVNEDQNYKEKRFFCEKHGIEYIVLKREPVPGLPARSSTELREYFTKKKILVAGTFDLLHSGHIAFFRRAAEYGDVYVGIGSDASVMAFKNRLPINPDYERLYNVKANRYVKDAWINAGVGDVDFMDDLKKNHAIGFDKFIINEDQDTEAKREYCKRNNIELLILKRTPDPELPIRSASALRKYT